MAAPVLTPQPERTSAASPAPESAPAPAPAPEPAPAPPAEPAPAPAPPPEPPAPPAPEPPPAAATRASAGEGDTGAVFAMSVPNDPQENPQPDVDVTVGSTPLVGDAPPSDGTDVDASVNPTTALERARRAAHHHPVVETLRRERLGSSPPLPASSGMSSAFSARGFGGVPRDCCHTAAARAAAHPGLQSEIESFSSSGTAGHLAVHPSGGP